MFGSNMLMSSITPESLGAYLSANGWSKTSSSTAEAYKYEHREGGVLLLPSSVSAPRYIKSVSNVIETLSEWEERSCVDIFQNIVSPNSDSLFFAFTGQSADKGNLPIKYVHDATSYIEKSILYSASGEWKPKPFYTKAPAMAREIADKVRFGQTQLGSFVMTVLLPHSRPVAGSAEPTERKVLKRILTGISQARECVFSGKEFDYQNNFKVGLNANLSEAISLLMHDDLKISITAKWNPTIHITDEFKRSFELEERTFEILDSIGTKYRREETAQSIIFSKAKVIGLNWDETDDSDEDDDTEDPVVTLKIIQPAGAFSNVRVVLDLDDYKKACRAHLDSKDVTIKGELSKYKNRWWLFNYSNFEILS